MSTKLDEYLKCPSRNDLVYGSDELNEALEEYLASRKWVDGPPPKGCKYAYIVVEGTIYMAWRFSVDSWNSLEGNRLFGESEILRHCPIPAAPPLPEPPKPAIPEEVAKNGDGCYRIGFKSGGYVINRVENNTVVLGYGRKGVAEYAELHHVTSWQYLGNIPLEVAEHGDGWYWRDDEIVRVHKNDVFFNGCMIPNSLTNDGCTWEYIPRRGGE